MYLETRIFNIYTAFQNFPEYNILGFYFGQLEVRLGYKPWRNNIVSNDKGIDLQSPYIGYEYMVDEIMVDDPKKPDIKHILTIHLTFLHIVIEKNRYKR